jgi:kynurenine formamidase
MNQIFDLTHTINPSIPTYDGSCGFCIQTILDYDDWKTTTKFKVQQLNLKAGLGTHIDAPLHCVKDGKDIALLDLHDLIAPLIVIDIAHKVTHDYAISVKDIIEFESHYGPIKPKSFVLGYTGWGKKWLDSEQYRNVNSNGNMSFPRFAPDAAALLVERDVCGIGIDTLSPDGGAQDYPVHNIFLSKGKYIVENVAYVKDLPTVGMFVFIMPLKIEGVTESPVRIVVCSSKRYL